MQEDKAGTDVSAQSISKSGKRKVIVRPEAAPSKDLYIEVWNPDSSGCFESSLKISEKVSKLFSDTVFGGISWSKDESKVCFIGEIPDPKEYKSPWENKKSEEEKKKEEEKKGEDKKEEEKEEHWQEDKFL